MYGSVFMGWLCSLALYGLTIAGLMAIGEFNIFTALSAGLASGFVGQAILGNYRV